MGIFSGYFSVNQFWQGREAIMSMEREDSGEMDSLALQKSMEKEISCGICLEIFTVPKSLPTCSHTFCEPCVERLLQRNENRTYIKCPICQRLSSLSHGNSMESIPTNHHLQNVAELWTKASGRSRSASVSGYPEPGMSFNDNLDDDEDEDGPFMGSLAKTARDDLEKLIDPLDKTHDSVLTAIDRVQDMQKALQSAEDKHKDELREYFKGLRNLLDQREQAATEKLEHIHGTSQKMLRHQLEDLGKWDKQLHSCKKTVASMLETTSNAKLVQMVDRVQMGARQLCTSVVKVNLEPECHPCTALELAKENKFEETCDTLCQVYCTPEPSATRIVEFTKDVIPVTDPIIVVVELQDVYGNAVIHQKDFLSCKLRIEGEGKVDYNQDFILDYSVAEVATRPGTYEVCYFPKSRAAHVISVFFKSILLDSQQIPPLFSACDFAMGTKRVINTFGHDNSSKFSRPSCIVRGPNDEIIVSDRALHKLIVFDSNLKFIRTISGRFNWPTGMALDRDGYLLLADRKNHCIQRINVSMGEVISKFGKKGSQCGEFNEPRSLLVTAKNETFIADGLNHRVQVFENEQFLFLFGHYGSRPGAFDIPCAIEINHAQDSIFIADSRNHRVQVFTINGRFISMFGDSGFDMGSPSSVCRLRDSHMLICCSSSKKVLVYTEAGKYVGTIEGILDEPRSLVVTKEGRLVITDHYGIVASW